jgi:hypothetical protein
LLREKRGRLDLSVYIAKEVPVVGARKRDRY